MSKPYQQINSEDFELKLHELVALIHRDRLGSVVFDCQFLQPTHTTAPSHQCYLYAIAQDCPEDAIVSTAEVDLGAINWCAVEVLQRWGYWDRSRFGAEWVASGLRDRRIHRQHFIYTSNGYGYAASLTSEEISHRSEVFKIKQSAHLCQSIGKSQLIF